MTAPNQTKASLRVVPDALDQTSLWGRQLHTVGRILSAVELLLAAAKLHRRDSRIRADELVDISAHLAELAEGVRAELAAHNEV